jgi:hypothetical protein
MRALFFFKLSPSVKDSEQELREMMERISEKNPAVLVGYTPSNQKLYDSMTRKKK